MATRELTGPRLSQCAVCPRAAALQARGVPGAEPSRRMRNLWTRGNLFSYLGYLALRERYDEDDIEREREVPWSVNGIKGVGHADFYIRSERRIIEFKSSTAPYDVAERAITQAKLYLLFDPEAESAGVHIVNPSDLEFEQLIPVVLTDPDRQQLTGLLESVAEAVNGGPLPPCTQGSPTACRNSGCLWSEHAWDDWEAPETTVLEPNDFVLGLIRRWHAMKEIEAQAKLAYAERKDVEAALIEQGVEPGDNDCGPYVIRRVVSKPRETFSWSTAKKSGILDGLEELLAPFVRLGEPSERLEIVTFE